MGEAVWKDGAPTDYGIEVYTCGDCWILAYYLARELNSQIGLVGGRVWGHAVATLPDEERYIDILGLHTRDSLVGKDFVYTLRGTQTITHMDPPISMRGYKSLLVNNGPWGHRSFTRTYRPTYRVAKATASKIIDKHLGVTSVFI